MVLWPLFCVCWFHLLVGTSVSTSTGKEIGAVALTSKQRQQLLQIDAAATGSVVPSVDSEVGELTWSSSPSERATIKKTGKWYDLPDNSLTFMLTRESHVVIKYLMVVVANQHYRPGVVSTSGLDSDFLGARLMLDGMPYRQSGSHASPLSALEASSRTMSGYIVSRLGAGSHTVSLQWRKWGSQVASWTVNPSFRDGFVTGRALTVSSRHRYLWFAQPLSIARTVVSSDKWHTVRDMEITFNLPREWTLRFAYSLQVRPQGSSSSDALGAPDFLSTRIVLDDHAYRESSTVSSSSTFTNGCATLHGEVTMKIPAGSHTVKLEWRRGGANVPLWWSHPNFLDGFVSGRMLTVTGEMYPFIVAQPLIDARIKTTESQGSNSSSVWRDIASTAINFDMINSGRVTFTYDVGVSQYAEPEFDEYHFARWSSIATRLVVDGRPFTHTGSQSDALVRANENLAGEITLTLPLGSHTARLQWRTFGVSIREWTTFQNILNGYGSSRRLLAMIHAVNSEAVITAPMLLSVDEDSLVSLVGVNVADLDVDVTPYGTVAVKVSAKHGTLTVGQEAVHNLTFASGDGKEDSMMSFVGTLSDVNVALQSFTYKPHPDYNGLEEVKIRVTDQGFTGGSEDSKEADHQVQINVRAKNDKPTFTVPASQMINEDATLLINGVGVFDVDIEDGLHDSTFEVSLHVVSGKLTLRTRDGSGREGGLEFIEGDGIEDAAMSFRGTLLSINAALSRLEYTGDSNTNSQYTEELLTLWIRDLGTDDASHGQSLNDTVTIPIHVTAVNDAPAVVVPRTQTILVSGYQVSDIDLATNNNICVNISVSSKQGHVSLATTDGLTMAGTFSGTYERFMSFRGTVVSVNKAMGALEYVRSPAFDGGDVIAVSLLDCASKQLVGETTMIELDINNRVGSTLSSTKRPAILSVVPNRGSIAGTTPVNITGINFIGHGPLFCQFGDVSVVAAVLESNSSLVCVTPSGLEPGSTLLRVTNNVDIWTNASEFVMDTPSSLLLVSPERGTVLGGTTLVMTGTNFPDSEHAQCIFGMTVRVAARWQSEGVVHCVAPPSSHSIVGPTTIQFSPNSIDIDTTQVLVYTYDHEATLSSMWPSQGASSGGTLIKLSGTHFRASTSSMCRFGTQDVKATYLSPTSMQCLSPAHGVGVVQLQVTMNGIDFSKDSLQFQFTQFVQVLDLSPRGGFVAGGTEIEVTTKNLRRGSFALCKFGGVGIVNATYEARNLLKCMSPPSTTNMYTTVEVSINGQDFTTNGVRFHYQLPAVVTAVTPRSGDTSGGTLVHIFGRNFHDSESLFCAFGSTIPPLWRRAGYRPDMQCNYVAVMADGTCEVDTAAVYDASSLSAVADAAVSDTQQKSVACFVRAKWMNQTHLTCVAPPFTSGIVKIEVTINDFDYTTNNIEYEYRASPMLVSITPSTGGADGGTEVTITGTGFLFSSLLSCLFGNVMSTASYVNETSLTCTSPPSTATALQVVTVSVMANGIDRTISQIGHEADVSFEYVALPTVTSILPSSGPRTKITVITVRGSNFVNTSSFICRFVDSNEFAINVGATFLHSTAISCSVPLAKYFSPSGAHISVKVGLNSQDFSRSAAQFSYNDDVTINQVSPSNGPHSGGTVLTISGAGYYDSAKLRCSFMGVDSGEVLATAAATYVSTEQVKCVAPTSETSSSVLVSVTMNGIRYTTSSASFEYVDVPSILSLSPAASFLGAPTTVHVAGTFPHVSPTLICLFGVRNSPATYINNTYVVCKVPYEELTTVGVHDLTVSSNGGLDVSNAITFTVYEQPSVTGISPSRGAIGGGTTIHIYGSRFVNSTNIGCKFGNTKTQASFVTSSELSCVAPDCAGCQTPTVVHVEVSMNGQDFTRDFLPFTYTHVPIVSYTNPTRSTTAGKSVISVHGYNFVDSSTLKCQFSNATESFVVLARWRTSEWIDCLSPSVSTQGTVHLNITNNGHEYSSEEIVFTYIEGAIVTNVNPSTGPITGGTNVVVSGTHFQFSSQLSCRFGDDLVSVASYVSSTMILCKTPKVTSSRVVPVVLVSGGVVVSEQINASFAYTEAARVLSVTPDSAPATGNETILMTGVHFFNTSLLQCVYGGDTMLPAIYLSDTSVSCPTPAMTRPQNDVTLELFIHSEYTTSNNVVVSFHSPPRTTVTSPTEGSIVGGDTISVFGHRFTDTLNLACWFGEIKSTKVKFVNSKQVECESPPMESPGSVVVTLSNNGILHPFESGPIYEFKAPVRVLSISPVFGTSSGGTAITLSGENFYSHSQAYCLFDMNKVKASFISANKVQCVSPSTGIGEATVRFSANGAVLSDDTHVYNYITVPSIIAIQPSWSFVEGNVLVSVIGTSFVNSSGIACIVGDTIITATFRNTTNIECLLPSVSTAAEVMIKVDINGQDRTREGKMFQYRKTPRVLMVSPQAGPSTGGTLLNVVGNNFVMWNNDVSCVFNEKIETQAVWVSTTRCTCMSPPNVESSGNVNAHVISFRLKAKHATFPANKEAMTFTYLPPMMIENFAPKFGSVGGSQTLVTLRGKGFYLGDALQCRFGTITVFAKYLNSTAIQCVAPHVVKESIVELGVSNDGSKFAAAVDKFEFTVKPFITFIHPPSGSVSKRSTVVVLGSNFPIHSTDSLACRFGEYADTKGTFLNTTAILCPLPSIDMISSPTPVQVSVSLNGHDVTNSDVRFTFLRDMLVFDLQPSRGHVGTDITLSGVHFVDSSLLKCKFGTNGHHVVSAVWISSTLIRCVLPNLAARVVTMYATNNGVDWSPALEILTIIPVPTVSRIVPSRGVVRGGTKVVVHGKGFVHSSSVMECMFGNAAVDVAFINGEELICIAPAMMSTTIVTVVIMLNGNVVVKSPIKFEYFAAPRISSIAPTMVDYSIKSRVIDVHGSGFMNLSQAACRFGQYPSVPATFVSATHVQCASPSFDNNASTEVTEQWITLAITMNGIDWSQDSTELQLTKAASIAIITPSNGFLGTVVHVYGQNFVDSGKLACKFGGIGKEVVQGRWVSSSLMTCVVPAKTISATTAKTDNDHTEVFVHISNNGVDFTQDKVTFTYTRAMMVSRIVPSQAYSDFGGDILLIDGNGQESGSFSKWNGSIRCRFGVHTSSAVHVNDTAILCTAPPQAVGYVEVYFTTNGLDYFNTQQLLKYVATPILSLIIPQHGSVSGGNLVTVTVADAPSSSSVCWFGEVAVVSTSSNASHITCSAPPHTAGEVEFKLAWSGMAGQFAATKQPMFTYYRVPRISRARPSQGSSQGGTNVIVHGSDFQDSQYLSCKFGDAVKTRGRWINNSAVECISPSHPPGDSIQLKVTNDGSHFVDGAVHFKFLSRLTLQSISPSKGPIEGGTLVTLRGSNFGSSFPQRCRFGRLSSRAIYINNTAISCITPRSDVHASAVNVSVTRNGGEYEDDVLQFEFYVQPTITSMLPREGLATATTEVTIIGQGFHPLTTTCRVSGSTNVLQTKWLSTTTMKCYVLIKTGGNVNSIAAPLEISNNGQNWVTSFDTFRTYESPQVDALEPSVGSEVGGTEVLVSGYGFLNRVDLRCLFGESANEAIVHAEWISQTLVQCVSPTTVPGAVSVQVSNNGVDFSGRASMFTYHEKVAVHSMTPKQGSQQGGTQITLAITSALSTGAMMCQFGSIYSVKAVYNAVNGSVSCVSPAVPHPIALNLSLSINGVDFVPTGMKFTFIASTNDGEYQTLTMSPVSGSIFGGTQVVLETEHGLWTDDGTRDLACTFGPSGTIVSATRKGTRAVCVTVPSQVGPAVVTLGLIDRTSGTLLGNVAYTYYSPMLLTSFEPTFGTVLGGTRMVFRGANFQNSSSSLSCIFGGAVYVEAKFRSTSMVECVTPPSLNKGARNVTVALTYNNQSMHTVRRELFQYTPIPIAAEIYPSLGPMQGGTVVTISGSYFDTRGHATCMFDDSQHTKTSANVINSTHMQCKTPTDMTAARALAVHPSFNGADHVDGKLLFNVYPDPMLDNIAPTEGAAGSQIALSGIGLDIPDAVYTCRFGSNSNTYVVNHGVYLQNERIVQCVVPDIHVTENFAPTKVDVSLNGGNDYTDSDVTFQYRRNVLFVSFSPTMGSEIGATAVQISGAYFYNTATIGCTFGKQKTTFATYINDTNIECVSPPAPPGTVKLSLTINGNEYYDAKEAPLSFTYHVRPFVAAVFPLNAVSSGGTLVTIHGGNYVFVSSLSCRFGAQVAVAVYQNASTVQCRVPMGRVGKLVSVEISNNGVDYVSNNAVQITYVQRPSVISLFPTLVTRGAPTSLTVTGKDFIAGQTSCMVGDIFVATVVINGTVLHCNIEGDSTTSFAVSQDIPVKLSTNGGIDYSHEAVTFSLVDRPQILSIFPRRASVAHTSMALKIHGAGFANLKDNSCSVGKVVGTIEWISSTDLRCLINLSTLEPGSSNVLIHSGKVVSNVMKLTLVPRPFIQKLSPQFASVHGDGIIHLAGPNLVEATSILCHFGVENMVAGKYINTTHVECITPRVAQPQYINLSLSFDGGAFQTNSVLFQYVKSPEIDSIMPADGSVKGGTTLTITGTSLTKYPGASFRCRFGDNVVVWAALVTAMDGEAFLRCVAPPMSNSRVNVDVSLNGGTDYTSSGLVFNYHASTRILSILPTTGPVFGATVVLVTGSNFYNSASIGCLFGTEKSLFSNFVNDTAIECTAPSRHTSGEVSIQVTMNGVDYVALASPNAKYTYSERPYISSVAPTRVMSAGGTTMFVQGGNFHFSLDLSCRVGTTVVPATYHNASTIECTAPNSSTVGKVMPLAVSNNRHDFSSSDVTVEYLMLPTVRRVSPMRLSRISPTNVIVEGNHFMVGSTHAQVSALSTTTKCDVISTTIAHCTVTPNVNTMLDDITSSTIEISTNNGVDFSNNGVVVIFKVAMSISALEPSSGPTTSQTLVTIRGNHLSLTSDMFCLFDGYEGHAKSPAVTVTSTGVQCHFPANRTGSTIVMLHDAKNNITTNSLLFTYFGTSMIISLQPSSGPRAGGSVVRVLGYNFVFSTSLVCQFGDMEVPATFVSSSEVRCVTPTRANFSDTDSINVAVASTEQRASNSVVYLYDYMPFISSVVDTSLYAAMHPGNNKRVTVNGTGFVQNQTRCLMQGTAKEEAMFGNVISPYQMECDIPADPTNLLFSYASTELLVSNNGQDYAPTQLHFRFGTTAMLTSVSPRSGPIHGGTLVVVTGVDFFNVPNFVCRFGDQVVPAQWISGTMAQCVTPSTILQGDVRLTMSNNGQRFSQLHDILFTYYLPVDIDSVVPASGSPTEGIRAIRVTGTRFGYAESLACRFNNTVTVLATFVSSEELICSVPNLWSDTKQHLIPIAVSKNGYDFTSPSSYENSQMNYRKSWSVSSIQPSFGPLSGGTMARVDGLNFYNSTQEGASILCRFGHVQSTVVTFVNETTLLCVSPPQTSIGSVQVMVSMNGLDYSENSVVFTYRRDIILSTIHPSTLSEKNINATHFRLTGANFVDTWRLTCMIAEHYVVGIYVSPAEVRCSIPPYITLQTGTHPISVSNNGADFARQATSFRVVPAIVVSSYSPKYGTVRGGTEIEIQATNAYRSGVSFCRFEGQHALKLRAESSGLHSIKCVAPRSLEGAGFSHIDISINGINWERVTTSSSPFQYVEHPTITRVSPDIGSYAGSTHVVLEGLNLNPAESTNDGSNHPHRCRFTSRESNFTTIVVPASVSQTKVICIAPGLPSELQADGAQSISNTVPVMVEYSSNGIDYYTSRTSIFSYVPTAQIFSYRPRTGDEGGGTRVVLAGLNLKESAGLMCKFGASNAAIAALHNDDTSITCISPPTTASHVKLMVTINGGSDWLVAPGFFTFFTNFQVEAVVPSSGSTRGGTGVHLHGSGFIQSSSLKCRVGEVVIQAIYVNSTTILCETRRVVSPVLLPIEISGNGVDFVDTKFDFQFYETVHLAQVLPTRIMSGAETKLIMVGEHFLRGVGASLLFCKFQKAKRSGENGFFPATSYLTVTAKVTNDTHMECMSPSLAVGSYVVSTGTLTDTDMKGGVMLTSVPKSTLRRVMPDSCPGMGGCMPVRLHGNHFRSGTTLRCIFGKDEVPATYLSSTTVECTPPKRAAGITTVALQHEGMFVSNALPFHLYTMPAINSITPINGPTRGKTVVTLRGDNLFFSSTSYCRFGSSWVASIYVNETAIKCITPPRFAGNAVVVGLTLNGVDFSLASAENMSFTYREGPSIHRVTPKYGSVLGGTLVTVEGKHLDGNTPCCRVGSTTFPAEKESDATHMYCSMPSNAYIEPSPLEVSPNCHLFSTNNHQFNYVTDTKISHIDPAWGNDIGGTNIHITGAGFIDSKDLKCRFHSGGSAENSSDYYVVALWRSSTLIECLSPPAFPSITTVEVTINGQDWSKDKITYEYVLAPQILQIAPFIGPTKGGTMVTVKGRNFTPRYLFCRFGVQVVSAIYISQEQMKCMAPSNQKAASPVPVDVSTNGVDFSNSGETFEYIRLPSVDSVYPSRGSNIMGGDSMVGIAYDSSDVSHCRFGVSSIKVSNGNKSTVRCARERRAYGIGSRYPSLVSMNDGQDTGPLSNTFYEHQRMPAVSSLTPTSGQATGGVVITVRGFNFTNTMELGCKFGDVRVDGQWFSPKEIRCITPRHIPSTVYVEVSNNDVDWSESGLDFVFQADSSVNSIHPTHGPERGMTLVTVYGNHFVNSRHLGCRFGLISTQAHSFVSQNEIVCFAPDRRNLGRPGSVAVEVTNNNQTYTTNAARYMYDESVLVSVLSPQSGPSSGQSRVAVYGYGFRDYPTLGCKFGDLQVKGFFITSSEIECVTPAMPIQRTPIEVTLNGYDYSFSKVEFNVEPDVIITNIWPTMGPAYTGGTVVTVKGSGFRETTKLRCKFGSNAIVPARFIDTSTIICRAPPSRPNLVSFEVTNNLMDFSTSKFQYLYHTDVSVSWVRPNRALITGQVPVFVRGTNFMNSTSLMCRFGTAEIRAIFLKKTLVVCQVPSRVVGYGINATREETVNIDVSNNGLDYSSSHVKFRYLLECPVGNYCPHLEMLATPNGTASASSGEFNFTVCEPGTFQPRIGQPRCLECPVGYICPDFGLSKPIICPAGFVCDKQGLKNAAVMCPSGHYCMQGTKTTDTNDFYGLAPHSFWSSSSTDNARISGGRNLAQYSWVILPETGLLRYNESVRNWKYLARPSPATGTSRPEHSPTMLTGGESHTAGTVYYPVNVVATRHLRFVKHESTLQYPISRQVLRDAGLIEDNHMLLAERPFPCPLGMYCKTGAVSNVTIPKNFSHPQRCMDGFFCPFGSGSPEGTGPCPTGYFCGLTYTENIMDQRLQRQKLPIYEATACPVGMYCPGVGVTSPKPCYPGTYNPFSGQSNCTTCPTGHLCPGWGRVTAEMCPAGFVCMSEGLSEPAVQCPAGYYCLNGTFSLQPDTTFGFDVNTVGEWRDIDTYDVEAARQALLLKLKATKNPSRVQILGLPLQPRACASGTFCLGGVKSPVMIDWIPSVPAGATAPQQCYAGAYCKPGTRTSAGTGPCFPGHYCPPGSGHPVEAP